MKIETKADIQKLKKADALALAHQNDIEIDEDANSSEIKGILKESLPFEFPELEGGETSSSSGVGNVYVANTNLIVGDKSFEEGEEVEGIPGDVFADLLKKKMITALVQ